MEDLAPGFRFYPTEEELVSFYLRHKLDGRRDDKLNLVIDRVIPVLDIYALNPWDLPQLSGNLCRKDSEPWFFFIPRQDSEVRGGRPSRLTVAGYWKASGCLGYVYSSTSTDNRSIGLKRTLIFYKGRAPSGRKTEWKINEYKAIEWKSLPSGGAIPELRNEFRLCRLYKKSKCFRTFDRPPEIGVRTEETRDQPAEGSDEEIAAHQKLPLMENTILSSPKSSSSSLTGHGHTFQTGESSNMDMDMNTEALWDWEQLDWYFSEENMQLN